MRFCVLILLLHTGSLSAQSGFQIAQHYTQQDGLSHTAVYDVYEDGKGFLWIATLEGLNRFDGHRFKKWYHQKSEPNSLAHNSVNQIMEYQPGLLLIATANGLSVFNTNLGTFENDRIQSVAHTPGAGANVTSLFRNNDGAIWVNQNGEIDILDEQLQFKYRLTDLTWAKSLKGVQISFESWVADKQGRIWLPSDNAGIQIIDVVNKQVFNRDHNPEAFPFMQFKHIRAFLLDEENDVLYVAPWGAGIYRYDLMHNAEVHQDFNQPLQESTSINAIVKLDNGHLWCSANGVFYEVNPITLDAQPIEFPFDKSVTNKSTDVFPITIIRSTPNRYWIGANEGLLQLERDAQQITVSHQHMSDGASCLDILVASTGEIIGLYDNFKLLILDSLKTTIQAIAIPHNKEDLLTQLCEDDRRQLWIGTSRGVLLFDLSNRKFVPTPIAIKSLQSRFVNALYSDKRGNIWIGTRQPFGVFELDRTEGRLEEKRNESLSQLASVNEYARISSFKEDEDYTIWMRSIVDANVIRVERKTNVWQRFPNPQLQVGLLEKKGLYAMEPDGGGKLWISTTTGDGLISVDIKSNSIKQFSREDGLLSDYIFEIARNKDYLYLTSSYGYSRFNIVDQTIVTRGWTNVPGSFVMALDTMQNQMILGSKGKFTIIGLETNHSIDDTPMPVIDGIFINHKERFINPGATTLRLAADQRNITIDFTATYYKSTDKIKFAYQLLGADQDWQYARDSRSAQYAALSPGNYLFRIKTAGQSGNWGAPIDALSFTIVPPFWMKPWFILLSLVLLGCGIFWIVRRRMNALQYESSLRQKIAETEMMALRAQMNPHFIFNSINSIDALIMNDDKYQATLYLNKFARLIRNVLDSSKQNTVPIEKDMETLKLYIELEQFRSENMFSSSIDIDPGLWEKDLRVPPLIIQPYVENAILHGLKNRRDDKGQLRVFVNRTQEGIHFTIQDNGVGRQFTMNGHKGTKTSYGMQMSSDRIMIFNQEERASVHITDLTDEGKPSGTRVDVNLKTA